MCGSSCNDVVAIDFCKKQAMTLGGAKSSWLMLVVDVESNKLLMELVVDSTSLEKLSGEFAILRQRPNFNPKYAVIDNVPPS